MSYNVLQRVVMQCDVVLQCNRMLCKIVLVSEVIWCNLWNNTLCNQDTDCHLEWMTWTFELSSRHWEDTVYFQHQKHVKSKAFTEVYQCLCPKMAPCQSYVPSHILRRTCEKLQQIQLQNIMDLRLTSSKLLFFRFFWTWPGKMNEQQRLKENNQASANTHAMWVDLSLSLGQHVFFPFSSS